MMFLSANDVSKTIFENLVKSFKDLIFTYWWIIALLLFILLIIKILDKLKVIGVFSRGLKSKSKFMKFVTIIIIIVVIMFLINLLG